MEEEGQPPAAVDVDAHPSPAAPSHPNNVAGAAADASLEHADSRDPPPEQPPAKPSLTSSAAVTAESSDSLSSQGDSNRVPALPLSNPLQSAADILDEPDTLGAQTQDDTTEHSQAHHVDAPPNPLGRADDLADDAAPILVDIQSAPAVTDIVPHSDEAEAPSEQPRDGQIPIDEHDTFGFEQDSIDADGLDWMNTGEPEHSTDQESAPAVVTSAIDAAPELERQPSVISQEHDADSEPVDPDDTFDRMLAQPVDVADNSGTDALVSSLAQPDPGDLQPVGTDSLGFSSDFDSVAPNCPQAETVADPAGSSFDAMPGDDLPATTVEPSSWVSQPTDTMPWDADFQTSGNIAPECAGIDGWALQLSEKSKEASIDWANGFEQASAEEKPSRASTLDTQQSGASIEDSWSKVFGTPESGDLDDSWNAAFATGFDDDDGLLEDTSVQLPASKQPLPVPATPPIPTTQPSLVQQRPNPAYSAAPPIANSISKPAPSSAPMPFFAELPSATVRSRKGRPQVFSQPKTSSPPAPPSPTQSRQTPREQTGARQMQFRAPDRMDPFPPQPSVPVPTPPTTYSPNPLPQQPPQSTSRYSPLQSGPSQAAPATRNSFAPNPSDLSFAKSTPPPPRSPYVPAPTAPSGPRFQYANPSTSSDSFEPLKRPSAPPAPTQGVAPAIPNPAKPAAYSPQPAMQPHLPHDIAAQDVSNGPTGYASGPVPPPANRFAPRTSSPLAHQDYRPSTDRSISSSITYLESPSQVDRGRDALQEQVPISQGSWQGENTAHPSQDSAVPGASVHQTQPHASVHSPQRPQTSSPSTTTRRPPVPATSTARPASVQDHSFSSNNLISTGRMPHSLPDHGVDNADYVLPTDETVQDPLQRWKGSPIFHWGHGGITVTSLPKLIPRYGGGQSAPKMKPVGGEVRFQRARELLSASDQLPPFPGPLKSKGKKKDTVAWLVAAVGNLENQMHQAPISSTAEKTRLEERIILWKIMKLVVEFDGILSGNPAVEAATREALKSQSSTLPQPASPIVHPSSPIHAQPASPAAINDIKQHLLQGEREKAIWYAVDNRLWAHAMLLSPTAGPTIWKQVVQEFVKKEVRSLSQDNQSMAALYQVLASNWDESIDELVPLSARSGFQMISTAATPSQARDAFEGLNKWRETLSLILSNRSPNDENGILSLGRLLAASGRVEAAHVCFLFAKSLAPFGGADDPQSVICLVGIDHTDPWSNGGVDIDAIRLTEVYEFALSLSPASYHFAPHLQAYKLQHALSLAETGQRAEALQYCEIIAAAMKSTTKLSPYYHGTLVSQLDDLQRRLSQAPKDGSSSWISRPTIGKVSSSMGTWFNSFVAGDDNDAASTGSGHQSEGESGPFARISGGTPIISRSTSTADFHGPAATTGPSRYAPAAYATRSLQNDDLGLQRPPPSGSPEQRYGTYSPRQIGDGGVQSHGSPPKLPRQPSHLSQQQSPYSPQPRPESVSSSGQRPSYEPYVPTVGSGTPSTYPENSVPMDHGSAGFAHDLAEEKSNGHMTSTNGYNPDFGAYQPPNSFDQPESTSSYEPPSSHPAVSGGYEPRQGGSEPYTPPQSNYEPPSGGYEPPTGGYEPYQPDVTDDVALPKRSMMEDDGDDIAARAEELKKQTKAQRDKAADDAFRAAAEADAARDKAKKETRSTSGWFGGIGGLFGGKKDPNAPTVHKAKLGEESSFYFDTETKRWVNRKGGSSPAPSASAATPPPPKMSAPPSRNVSSATGAPPPTSAPSMPPGGPKLPPSSYPIRDAGEASGPPSRSGTPASVTGSTASDMPASSEPLALGTQSPALGTQSPAPELASAPATRPPTSMSNASSIDDLIGVPQARKGGTIKKGKKGQRYIDVMAK